MDEERIFYEKGIIGLIAELARDYKQRSTDAVSTKDTSKFCGPPIEKQLGLQQSDEEILKKVRLRRNENMDHYVKHMAELTYKISALEAGLSEIDRVIELADDFIGANITNKYKNQFARKLIEYTKKLEDDCFWYAKVLVTDEQELVEAEKLLHVKLINNKEESLNIKEESVKHYERLAEGYKNLHNCLISEIK